MFDGLQLTPNYHLKHMLYKTLVEVFLWDGDVPYRSIFNIVKFLINEKKMVLSSEVEELNINNRRNRLSHNLYIDKFPN